MTTNMKRERSRPQVVAAGKAARLEADLLGGVVAVFGPAAKSAPFVLTR
jgi:hypothetical protein